MPQKYNCKNQNIGLHSDLFILHKKNRNTVKVLFGCSTGGLVSYLSPAYGGSDVTVTFLKKRNKMSGKTERRDRKLVHI